MLTSFSLDPQSLSSLPEMSWTAGITGYCLLLALISLQNRAGKTSLYPRKKQAFLLLSQCEILAFLIYLDVYLLSPVFYHFHALPQFTHTLAVLGLYLVALGVFYLTSVSSSAFHSHRLTSAWKPIQFLIPFTVPFLLFTLLADLYSLLPGGITHSLIGVDDDFLEILWISAGSMLFLIGIIVFLPYVIQKAWGCKDFPSSDLKTRLDKLCTKAQFKHAGMKTWPVLKGAITAGIIGIYSRFRYVMFTDSLLQHLSPGEVEAVLCHEIAHSKYRHLLFYPLLILGIGTASSLFTLIFGEALSNFFKLQAAFYPSFGWHLLELIVNFVIYAGIFVIYFRLVFGLFSRNFERQADLYVFKLCVPPQEMINALDAIARFSGNTHDTPNWHHYSVRQRIQMIQYAMANPKAVKRHQRKVIALVLAYGFILIATIGVLLLPLTQNIPILSSIGNHLTDFSQSIDQTLNGSQRSSYESQNRKTASILSGKSRSN